MKGAVSNLWTRIADVAGLVATPLSPAHYLELFRPLAAKHAARVEAVQRETPDVATLTLRPGRGWQPHVAGQHVPVGLAIAGRIATRTYSISSAPERGDGCITITVKAQGHVSNALVALAPGSYVTLGLPAGEFRPTSDRLLYITGGSGITPIASMLRSFAARGAMPDIVHVHYTREDVIFGDELAALASPYRLHVIRTAHDRRRLDRERLDALVPDWQARETLACGPPGLLEAVAFTNARVERFTAAVVAPANASGGHVRFATSRVSAIADGRTPLLRIAEDAGVSAPHGCRMGICHTCDATLAAGCVRDLRTGERIDAPGARVQICVCAAAGDVELAL
jgi:ferredoxin-NADP reductase